MIALFINVVILLSLMICFIFLLCNWCFITVYLPTRHGRLCRLLRGQRIFFALQRQHIVKRSLTPCQISPWLVQAWR